MAPRPWLHGQCHTEAPLPLGGFSRLSPRPSFSRNLISFKASLASRSSNESFREEREVGTELGAAIGRRGLGLAPSTLQRELELVPSCPGPRFPQLHSEGMGLDILHGLDGPFCVSSC